MTRFLGFLAGVVVTLAVVHRTGVPGLQELPLTVADVQHRLHSVLAAEAGSEPVGADPLLAADPGLEEPAAVVVLPEPPPGPELGEGILAAGGDAPGVAATDPGAGAPVQDAPFGTDGAADVLPDGPTSEPAGDLRPQNPVATDPVPDPGNTAAGALGTPPGGPASASIWAPFRSERSAEGFAGYLRERFDMKFEVRRAAPGIYQVFLTAESETGLTNDLARLRVAGTLASLEDKR